MRRLTIVLLCILLSASPAAAAGGEDAYEAQRDALELDELERAAREAGSDMTMEEDWEGGLEELFRTGTAALGGILRTAASSCVMLLSIVLFCSVCEGMGTAEGQTLQAVQIAGAVGVTAVAVSDVGSLLGLGRASIDAMTGFSNVLLPTVAAVTAATGAVAGASVRQAAAVTCSTLLINAVDKLLIPLLYGSIAANVAAAATGNDGLKRLGALFKWAVVTLLTILMTVYIAYLTGSGVVAGSADAAAVKAARFAISGAVPVVGGILGEASESVLAAAGILRSSVGIFGMLTVLSIVLIPFLRLAVHYLAYKLCAALAATIHSGGVCGLIDSFAGAFGAILGMTGACALILLVSIVSSISLVTV